MFKKKNNFRIFCIIALVLIAISCSSSSMREDREKKILEQYSEQKESKYAAYLVDLKQYTTNGDYYQRKYIRLLIGLAGEVLEQKKLQIAKGSIGFYFDRKAVDKKKLYLGMDVLMSGNYADGYIATLRAFYRKHLKELLSTVYSCQSVFKEKGIVGLVIGFKWKQSGEMQQANIWISKLDVERYENNKLTFDELIQRNFITNTKGRIIRLPQ